MFTLQGIVLLILIGGVMIGLLLSMHYYFKGASRLVKIEVVSVALGLILGGMCFLLSSKEDVFFNLSANTKMIAAIVCGLLAVDCIIAIVVVEIKKKEL